MKQNKFIIMLSIVSAAATAMIYASLPEQIPLHWGINGQIDRYGPRAAIFLTAVLPLAMYGLFLMIPKIDPRKDSYEKHAGAYSAIVMPIILFMIGLHWITIGFSLGYNIDIVFVVKLAAGLLFMILGNYLPVIRHNYTLGIRTPWTLSDEKVWTKTHRAGGYIFVISGLIWAAFSFFNQPWVFYFLIGEILVSVLGVFVYSYMLFRRIHK
ncbi:MAG: SdpI family protein [Spirochaetia bacterium]|nr:SdpI family protein [Spirochaetia bacterium]